MSAGTIFFVSNRDGDDEIYSMNFDGSGVTQLTFNEGIADDSPFVSGDRSKVTFSRQGNIWIMDSDGTDQIKLTDFSVGTFTVEPCFDIGHSRIAFISNDAGEFDLYTMDADGGNLANLTIADNYGYRSPAYSLDGNHIFVAAAPPAGNQDIYRFDADGTNRVRITNTSATETRPRIEYVIR